MNASERTRERDYDPRGIIPMVELPGKIPVVLPVILTLSKLYRVEWKVLSCHMMGGPTMLGHGDGAARARAGARFCECWVLVGGAATRMLFVQSPRKLRAASPRCPSTSP